MRRHALIAACLYPLFEVLLLGIGFGASWLLADNGVQAVGSVVHSALAALILSLPLARETAKLFLTPQELKALGEDD